MHFRTPFKIAYETVETADIVTLSLANDQGLIGFGSAAPDPEVTGETVDRDFDVLNSILTPEFFDRPISDLPYYHEKIQTRLAGLPSAQSATEEAILNLLSNQTGVPLGAFFGPGQPSSPIMITIGISDEKKTAEEVKQRLAEGFKVIKMKVGLDLKNDIARIRAARAEIPKNLKLTLDANQGYSFEQAERLLQALRDLDITLLEQPIAADDLEGLKRLHQSQSVPIVADEAVVSAEDAIQLMADDFIAGVNIKLMKCGGPLNFLKIHEAAKRFGKLMMIGCMYESNVSITTGAHLALALNLDYVDLDSGHLDFDDDPIAGGAVVEQGHIRLESPLRLKQP